MPVTELHHDPEEVARLGAEILDRQVRPTLRHEDDGKFVAIDILTGDHELDADDYAAVTRLRARRPDGEVWLGRVGQPAAYRMRQGRSACSVRLSERDEAEVIAVAEKPPAPNEAAVEAARRFVQRHG